MKNVDIYLCRYGISVDIDGEMAEGIREIKGDYLKPYQVETRGDALMSFDVPEEIIDKAFIK